ncbi:MAG: FHA domain-containing protein [Lentisphaerae bacterium]|jgi:hypothetical protein|nr:FHA domain-containing protein [Lentisphaerota bacterium]MBT4821313.1 FHA domain-containing protein [Lentisphaerota bacterium]MBT5612844.1 FHA domain-containing protein [Lentisphaerota bacterium]MBT7059690.1 FHA domain-containing protein [Lentisphaerota bacterium]MBT7841585.1 FHA domain-containing protein [Lentisphaerota bacterium]
MKNEGNQDFSFHRRKDDVGERTQIHDPRFMPDATPPPTPKESGERKRKATMRVERKQLLGDITVGLRAHLDIFEAGPGVPESFELGDEEVVLGRNADCLLRLDLDHVSRHHAKVYFLEDEYYLEDLQSTNGTFVNGVQVTRCVLRNNDLVEIGATKLYFVEERIRQ